jgi:hypothetical protein
MEPNLYSLETGKSCSKNFVLKDKITTMDEFQKHVENNPSIFWRDKPYPCAVLTSQQYKVIANSLKQGLLWSIKPKK